MASSLPDPGSRGPGGRPDPDWLGDGGMARRIRAHDWAATPLGPLEEWSETLRAAASLCLHSRFPMALWWGPQLTGIYNEAYAAYLGPGKHPRALGRPYRDVWGEIWEVVEELFAALFEEKRATWREDQQLMVRRDGYAEEAFFTYNLSPVVGEDGRVAGALNVVWETTRTVLANRRIRTLERASAASAGATDVAEAGASIARELGRHDADLPFSILYLVDGEAANLIGASGVAPGSEAAPARLALETGSWPLARAVRSGEPVRVDAVDERFPAIPPGPWPEPVRQALVLPLTRGGLQAALVAGVSPRRALDAPYRRFLTSLGETVAAALADAAAQERERDARLEAEEANRAKSEFLTAMSHELRTPLNAIAGYVDLLDAGVHGELSDDHRQALERVAANQRHLLTLINDILLFARIDAARLEFRDQELDASELVESLEPLLHPQAVRKEIDYAVGDCGAELRLRGDRERVRQILLNLAGNAIKFTPRGGRVRVSCAPSEDGEHAEFRVADNGPGIPRDSHREIFDPFTQVERRLARPQEGTGLGLPISRDLARAMGGDITVESEPGGGATFIVTLPRLRTES